MDLDFISSYHQSSQQQQSLLPSITSSAALSRPPTPLPSPSASSMPFAASVPLPHASDDHLQGSAASTYLNPYYHQPTATFTSPNDYYYFNSNQQQQHCQNSHQYYYASYAGYAMNNYTANGHLDPGVFGDYFGPEDTRSLYRPPAATTAMASPVKADHDAIAAHEKAKWSTRPDDADDPVRITELSTTKASNERFDFGSYNPVGHTSSTNDPSMIDGRSDGEGRSFDECSAGGKDYEYIASDSCCDSQRNDDCDPGSNYITITRTTTNGDVIQIVTRRRSANKKERRRTQSINSAFSNLRDCIPNVPADTKLSKIKTLRLATNYITYLMKLLNSPLENCMTLLAEGFRADLSNAKRSTQQNRIETQNEIQRQLRLQQYKQSIISNKKQHQNQQKSKMAAAGRNSKQSIINSRSISNNHDHGPGDQNRTIYPDQQPQLTTTPPIASPTLPHPPPPFQPSVPTLPSSMQLSPPSSSASSPSSSSLPPSLPLSSSMIIDRCPPPLPPPPITTDNYATTMMMYDQSKQTNNLWTFP